MNSPVRACITAAIVAILESTPVHTWSPQGHRLVALVAANHLTAVARDRVKQLLGDETLADVAVWADDFAVANSQTGLWHYVNLPADAATYDRDRDCPRQQRVTAGGRGDQWRDCAIDRILYHRQQLADRSLDRADRAIALKFLIHLVGDLHQPFHAIDAGRGGNDIPVSVYGSTSCTYDDGTQYRCNLHGTWDTELLAHRRWDDRRYLDELEDLIERRGWSAADSGTPAAWALESHDIGKSVLSAGQFTIDDAYYHRHISQVEERLALGGLRLAAILNEALENER
jgi:hypothetical protein